MAKLTELQYDTIMKLIKSHSTKNKTLIHVLPQTTNAFSLKNVLLEVWTPLKYTIKYYSLSAV